MRCKDFLTIRDFNSDELRHLLDLARDIKAHPARFSESLAGKTLALIFEKPSLRTRVSFDVGIQQLGGFSVFLSPSEINLGKRESLYDVAKNLERMLGFTLRNLHMRVIFSKLLELDQDTGLSAELEQSPWLPDKKTLNGQYPEYLSLLKDAFQLEQVCAFPHRITSVDYGG